MALLTYARAFAITAASLEFSRGQINGAILLGHYANIDSSQGLGAGARAALDLARALCADIPSLNPVVREIDRLIAKLEIGILPLLLSNDLEHLQHRMFDSLGDHYYYPVTRTNAELYSNPKPFGDQVFDAFPSARSDIERGTQCAVLGQPTAAVFHMMRVMEVGLRVLGREADIPYASSWEAYMRQFNKKFEADRSSKDSTWLEKEASYRELCGDVFAIKTAWRNPTMHVERNYTSEEVVQIYGAVSTFMHRLACLFKEEGKPIAAGLVGHEAAENTPVLDK